MMAPEAVRCSPPVGGERGSGILAIGSDLYLAHSSVAGNDRSGIFSVDGAVYCSDCYISRNANHAISVVGTSLLSSLPAVVALVHCDLAGNRDGIVSYAVFGPLREPVGANSNSRHDQDQDDDDDDDDHGPGHHHHHHGIADAVKLDRDGPLERDLAGQAMLAAVRKNLVVNARDAMAGQG
eukprot:gene14376-19036_t